MKRYDEIPHTSDLAVRIYGKTVPELFENAAYAMFNLTGDINNLKTDEVDKVEVSASDNETLLISWLSELLYLAYSKKALFSEFHIISLKENKLIAEIKGEKISGDKSRLRSEIKAATYHDLEIKKTSAGFEVTIVFDV